MIPKLPTPAAGLRRDPASLLDLIFPAILIAINGLICHKLFALDFSKHMDSIESSYMSISRYATQHWGDLSWFPLWYTGMPFAQVYQPGLHLTVAACSALFHITVQHAYHIITALAYVLGPVSLFFLCLVATRSQAFAFVTAIIYSLISLAHFFSPILAHDTGGRFYPRRLFVLLKYGEGPHTTALLLLPLAILFLHLAVTDRRPASLPLASCALAAIVITNWPGTVALSLAVVSYCLSRLSERAAISWVRFCGLCISAYLIICPWIPPSAILFVERNAKQSDPTKFDAMHYLCVAIVLLTLGLLHVLFARVHTNPWLRFFVYFAWLTGSITLAYLWFNIRLLPQPWRFQLEFEMGMAGVIGYLALLTYRRVPNRTVRRFIAGAFTLLCLIQIRTLVRFARGEIGTINIEKTIEYRMAKAFEQHAGGNRVFAPGNVSLWMNMFTDVPQVVGCCDQSVPTFEHRIATFIIYTGQDSGDRDAHISLLWLRAYGAKAIGVTGKNSSEPFKPYWHPEKFVGILSEVWRDGDDVIFDIPQRSASLAHVIRAADVIRRAPVNGLDISSIEPYVQALDKPDLPLAELTWINPHHLKIRANMDAGEVLSVQETYDVGWAASVAGSPRLITSDALGMMIVEPRCAGPCVVDLVYDRRAERIGTRIAAIAGGLFLLAWLLISSRLFPLIRFR